MRENLDGIVAGRPRATIDKPNLGIAPRFGSLADSRLARQLARDTLSL